MTELPKPIDDGGPVHPSMQFDRIGDVSAARTIHEGMSLRAHIATKVMASLCAQLVRIDEPALRIKAEVAVKAADVLIAELRLGR